MEILKTHLTQKSNSRKSHNNNVYLTSKLYHESKLIKEIGSAPQELLNAEINLTKSKNYVSRNRSILNNS